MAQPLRTKKKYFFRSAQVCCVFLRAGIRKIPCGVSSYIPREGTGFLHFWGGDRTLCTMTQNGIVRRPKSSTSKSHPDLIMSLAFPKPLHSKLGGPDPKDLTTEIAFFSSTTTQQRLPPFLLSTWEVTPMLALTAAHSTPSH